MPRPAGTPARWLGALALLVCACSPAARPDHRPPPYRPVAQAPVSAWPSAFGDAAHGSPTRATGPQTARVRWSRRLEGAVTPGPVVGRDGSVLAASNGGVLHALDPRTGRDRWTYDGHGSYGDDLSTSAAVLADGTILWPAPGDRLLALTGAGKLLWTLPLDGFVLSPAVIGDRAWVADKSGTLLALDVGPGGRHAQAWRLHLGGPCYSSPAVSSDGRVYTTHDHDVVAVTDRGTSATVEWHLRTKDLIEVSPAVAPDGTVVVGTNADVEYGVRPDGTVRWRYERGDWTYSSAVVRDGRATFGNHLGFVDTVDAATGKRLVRSLGIPKDQARSPVGTGIWTAPLVDARADVYVGTAAGHVYGFARNGQRLWDADLGAIVSSYPALLADGTLVIGAGDGRLLAFGAG